MARDYKAEQDARIRASTRAGTARDIAETKRQKAIWDKRPSKQGAPRSTHRSPITPTGGGVSGIPLVEMPPLPAQNAPQSFTAPAGGLATVEMRARGPFFDGMAQVAITAFLHEAVQEIAAQALAEWHHNLNASLVHPTPYYETQIMVQAVSSLTSVVHDRGIVYGPWLEGTSSRNQSTRFKGYASLRRAWQTTQSKVVPLAAAALARFISRMN